MASRSFRCECKRSDHLKARIDRYAAGGIEMRATAPDAPELETLTDVVARHLIRFGADDELVVSWAPGA
jgi:hypothetical protein